MRKTYFYQSYLKKQQKKANIKILKKAQEEGLILPDELSYIDLDPMKHHIQPRHQIEDEMLIERQEESSGVYFDL